VADHPLLILPSGQLLLGLLRGAAVAVPCGREAPGYLAPPDISLSTSPSTSGCTSRVSPEPPLLPYINAALTPSAHGFPAVGDMAGATVHLAGSWVADSASLNGAVLVQ
jgi:hypothetical protein